MTTPGQRTATLHAYLSYRDAPAAMRWLERAFGFETTMEVPDGNGGVMHGEIRLDDVAVTIFTDNESYDRLTPKGETVGHGLYVAVASSEAVDTVFASAVAADATVVWTPEMSEWGNYRCRVRDLEGYEWTFGTHRPGQPVSGWE